MQEFFGRPEHYPKFGFKGAGICGYGIKKKIFIEYLNS